LKLSLKRLASWLPQQWQQDLKRLHFRRAIRNASFRTTEPEYAVLSTLAAPGDWVIDIGANVGHYTLKLSDVVGVRGRVIALEPVPDTFELLTANAALARHQNITLVNAAAAESTRLAAMSIPTFDDTGLTNFYQAQLADVQHESALHVMCIAVDALDLPHPIRLVKIDTEGHELAVLRGMVKLLKRDRPTLIVEDNAPEVGSFLTALGYQAEKLPGSSNYVFKAAGDSLGQSPKVGS
jgi:FkbM family methyltransferase